MKLICTYLLIICLLSTTLGEKKLTIHFVPHSHNDAGWLMPFESYYQQSTKHIISGVVNVLNSDSGKKFHWADFAFFMRWWSDQNDDTKKTVYKLVNENRLIFINGGWVMNDEACPSYKESLMQMRYGLDMIQGMFGQRPTIGWQIDPFGSTGVTVANLHKLGYDALVENRISNDFKDKLEHGDGFNFYWEGHQVSKDKSESNLLTHILQYFYIIPDTRLDSQFERLNLGSYKSTFFSKEIKPVLNELKAITNDTLEQYHVMVPIGDDFGFKDTQKVFDKFDELIPLLNEEGKRFGYNTTTKYSSLYEYFDELRKTDIELGQFKGDFLPYQEPFHNWNDFWTGYYSTRLHMKRFIRYTFNDIQATKLMLASRAITANKGSINFTQTMADSIDYVNDLIQKANAEFLILMHHDGITGTHTASTEASYYFMLKQAQEFTETARNAIEKDLSRNLPKDTINQMKSLVSKLTDPEILHYTIVNLNGYIRNEVINITLPAVTLYDNFIFVVQDHSESKIYTDVEAYIADIDDMDNARKDLTSQRKGFLKVEVPALGEIQIYVLRSTGGSQECDQAGVNCAKWIKGKSTSQATVLSNSHLQAHFTQKGEFMKLVNLEAGIAEVIEESFTFYETSRGTRSGIYIFNPRYQQKTCNMTDSNTRMQLFTIGDLATILQVYMSDGSGQFLKTHVVYNSGSEAIQKQLYTELQSYDNRRVELSYSLKKVPHSQTSTFKAYADDSMKLVQRPIYDRNIGIKATNEIELNGYFTSSCVHGGMLRESYTVAGSKNNEAFFGWSNSNPIGCTFSGDGQVDIMIFRSIQNNDYKGISENMIEQHVTSTGFQIYIESSLDRAFDLKLSGNAKLNEPLTIFERILRKQDLDNMHYSSSLLEMTFESLEHPHQLSNKYGEIDVVDVKMIKHNVLADYSDHEIDLVLRNRFNAHVKMDKPQNLNKEGIFKNKFIDVFKKTHKAGVDFKMNSDKKILAADRYELQTLEEEVDRHSPAPSAGFKGLEPYEMAQFKLVWSGVLKALELEHKKSYQSTDAG